MAKQYDDTLQIRLDEHWWRLALGAPVHKRLVPYGHALLQREGNFHRKNLARERIYRGVALQQYRVALQHLERGGLGMARLNAIKAICDTFSSRISKDRPMAGVVTTGRDWSVKRKGQRFREFIVGQMIETEFDDLSRFAVDDATQLGNAFTRIDDNADALFAERIPINDLLFDRRECKYGMPQQAIRLRRMARAHLAELFPKHRDAIERAPASARRPDDSDIDGDGPHYGDLGEYVDTWEAWHPPTSKDEDGAPSADGRHVLCIDGDTDQATLVHEAWREPRFPWAMYQLMRPHRGIYADGFVDQLADLQHRINAIVRDIQMNLAATGRGFFIVNEANDVPVENLTGFQPFKLKIKGGEPPKWEAPQPFNAAQMAALDKFIDYAFRFSGVSQANAESRSALGAGASGVALNTQYDIDSDRFRQPQANYARYRLQAAQCYIDAAARVAWRRQNSKGARRAWMAVSWRGKDAIEQLDFNKIQLKDADYRLRIEPVGFLPDTRAGKIEITEQLAKAGVIPQWFVPALFDEPDLVEANRIILAPFKNCLRKMDLLADENEDAPVPEQYNDLELELKIATSYYNWVQSEKAPPEIETRFRDYIDLVVYELKKKNPPAAEMNPAAMGVPPGAAPMPQGPMPPMPGGVPMMPAGPVPQPPTIGAVPAPMAA
jgi:hypothetical protein